MTASSKSTKHRNPPHLNALHSNSALWHKIKVFVFDLRHFKERTDSRDRLELITDPSYIGAPYFESSEIHTLKTLVPDGQECSLGQLVELILDEKLNRRMKKRVATADYRVCAAHDLAPLFEAAFAIKPKDLQRDKRFVKQLTADGLLWKQ
ncbi:MAG: hypothetical protein Q9225_003290 [Loekoesia sp. 1 TL-2023]